MNAIVAAPMKYLDKAVTAMLNLGLPALQEAQVPAVAQITQLAALDEAKVIAIARVLQHSSHFNALMRDEITSAAVSDRYTTIIRGFDSIRDDAKRMIDQLADGKIDFSEKMQNVWMTTTRGDIPARFARIKQTYLEVSRDSGRQLERESTILEMYKDFRLSMKGAAIDAQDLLKLQTGVRDGAQAALQTAQSAVDTGDKSDAAACSRLEMARDERARDLQDEDARYQIAKDLAENLQLAYATSEAVMARVMQTHDVKKRVHDRAISFFATNETVFTALNAAFTSQMGLHETTARQDAMTQGMSKSLEAIATVGDDLLNKGLASGYGSAYRVDSVKKLVDSVVGFQESSMQAIEQLRAQSTKDAAEISDHVEQGKKRYAASVCFRCKKSR